MGFNPAEPRDPHGRWWHGSALPWTVTHGTTVAYKGHLGVDRADMPQLSGDVNGTYVPSSELVPKFAAHLRGQGITVTEARVPAASLKPTQTTGDIRAIRSIADHLKSGELADTKPITVSSDNRVLDGHHNWAGRLLADTEGGHPNLAAGMPVIQAGIPIGELIAQARAFGKTHGIGQRKTGEFANPAHTQPATRTGSRQMTDTSRAATEVHEKVGHTDQGLWHHKGMQLPAYIQHVANDLIASGHPESEAVHMAVGLIQKWAHGGASAKPDTVAKAVEALAEWERLKAQAKVTRGGPMAPAPSEIFRYYPLDDIRIERAAEGSPSGRVVEAYATVFDEPAEIMDGQGHYLEVIDRTAFDQVLGRLSRSRGGFGSGVRVLFNHGKTMEGQPAPEFQRPIGKPLDIRADGRGLLTRTEYAKKPFADEILDDIREGRITGQSFVGGIVRSDPELRGPGDKYRGRGGSLTTVRRMALGLREYGPVLYGAYTGAEFLGVRMQPPGGDAVIDDVDETDGEEFVPGMERDGAGGTPEEVTSPRAHAHSLFAMRTSEAGIKPVRGIW